MGFGEILREFGVKIGLDFDKKALEEANRKIEKIGSEMRRFSIEVAAAAGAIFEFGNLASSNSRDLQQTSQMLGVSTDQLQEFAYAAKVAAGVSRNELVGSLEAVSETMDKARHGDVMASEGLLRLAQAGVGVDKMMGLLKDRTKTSTDVMLALSESFKNIKDPMAAARLASEAFGGAGVKLLPLLRQGPEGFAKLAAEAHKLGIVLGKDTIDKGAEMDRQFTRMWEVFKNLSYTIGFELLKYIKPVILEFEHFLITNKKLIAVDVAGFMKVLASAVMAVFGVANKLVPVFSSIIKHLGGIENASKIFIGVWAGFKVARVYGLMSGLAAAIGLPLAPIGLLVAAVHDVWKILSGGTLKDTWIGALIDGIQGLLSSLGIIKEMASWTSWLDKKGKGAFDKIHDFAKFAGENIAPAMVGATPAGGVIAPSVGGSSGGVTQQFTLQTTNNIGVPPGTSATAAAGMISKSTVDSHDQLMIKAKNDATRRRQY